MISRSKNSAELPAKEDNEVVIVFDHTETKGEEEKEEEEDNEVGFICPVCEKVFKSGEAVEKHVKSQHKDGFEGVEMDTNHVEDLGETHDGEEARVDINHVDDSEDRHNGEEAKKVVETVPRVAGDARWLEASVALNTDEQISKRFGQNISVD